MTAPLVADAGTEAAPQSPSPTRDDSGDRPNLLRTVRELDQQVARASKERPVTGGIPVPRDGDPSFSLESRHPHRQLLEDAACLHDPAELRRMVSWYRCAEAAALEPETALTWARSWYSDRLQADVDVYQTKAGRYVLGGPPRRVSAVWMDRLYLFSRTQLAARRFSLRAERRAQQRLRAVVSLQQWRAYMVTGAFAEVSPRSGVTYWLRRLRPTIALTHRLGRRGVRTALCLHPVGYHNESFAGLLAPSADVFTHLMLLRCDEHRFWRTAEQHSFADPRSGL
jgi:hypothetical protein